MKRLIGALLIVTGLAFGGREAWLFSHAAAILALWLFVICVGRTMLHDDDAEEEPA